jgi:hypothetical protein
VAAKFVSLVHNVILIQINLGYTRDICLFHYFSVYKTEKWSHYVICGLELFRGTVEENNANKVAQIC